MIADYSGNPVAGVSKWVTNLGVDITTHPGLYANLTWMYKDGMPITSDAANFATSYSLLNTKIGFRNAVNAKVNIDLFIGINNIGGVQYPLMVFSNQLPDAYLPGPNKANYFGGINFKYNF